MRFARRDPKNMSPELFDRWYCSPYVQSIAYQLQEAIPHSRAEQIRQVAQNEGTVLSRIEGPDAARYSGRFAGLGARRFRRMATAIFERRSEVGLMKALGAGNVAIAALFSPKPSARPDRRRHRLFCRIAARTPDRPQHLQFANLGPARSLPCDSRHRRVRHLCR